MKKITSVSELPDWFKNRSYKKRLSKVDWFREIRMRETVIGLLEEEQRDAHFSEEVSDKDREFLLKMLEPTSRPDSSISIVPHSNRPVHDLTAGEALYLRSVIRDEDLILLGKYFNRLLLYWLTALKEGPEGPGYLLEEYDERIRIFFDKLKKHPCAGKMDEPIVKFLDGVGNPWLYHGRALNGFPITIDTQYDDETIINYFKSWLAEKRKTEGERVRRPFNQNDFDDWEHYKIREIFDLDIWATLMNVKILDKVIAHSLWPNPSDDFSPIDVLRTTARKKVKEVFTYNVAVRFYRQLLLEYGENFLGQ